MLRSTPEYVQAHISSLKTTDGSGEASRHRMEAVARHRRERRERIDRLTASIYRSLPFVNRRTEVEAVPAEVPTT
jgi:hypothetical protein